MDGRGTYLRVGFLIVVGLAIGIALAWFLGGARINNGTEFETYFSEPVQGLQKGSNVNYRGVTVGRVVQIGVAAAEYGSKDKTIDNPLYRMVYVRFLVDTAKIGPLPGIQDAIQLGLRARLDSQLITGVSYIDLDFVSPQGHPPLPVPWMPRAAYIPSVPSTFAQVRNAGQELLAKLDKVDVAKFVATLTDLSERLDGELENGDLHRVLVATDALMTNADKAVTAADLPKLVDNLRQTSDALRAVAENPELSKMLSNGAMATDRLAELTAKMGPLVTALQNVVRQIANGTAPLQTSLAPLLRNMQAVSENLRELSSSLRQYPAQLLSGPPPPVRGPLK